MLFKTLVPASYLENTQNPCTQKLVSVISLNTNPIGILFLNASMKSWNELRQQIRNCKISLQRLHWDPPPLEDL